MDTSLVRALCRDMGTVIPPIDARRPSPSADARCRHRPSDRVPATSRIAARSSYVRPDLGAAGDRGRNCPKRFDKTMRPLNAWTTVLAPQMRTGGYARGTLAESDLRDHTLCRGFGSHQAFLPR